VRALLPRRSAAKLGTLGKLRNNLHGYHMYSGWQLLNASSSPSLARAFMRYHKAEHAVEYAEVYLTALRGWLHSWAELELYERDVAGAADLAW